MRKRTYGYSRNWRPVRPISNENEKSQIGATKNKVGLGQLTVLPYFLLGPSISPIHFYYCITSPHSYIVTTVVSRDNSEEMLWHDHYEQP